MSSNRRGGRNPWPARRPASARDSPWAPGHHLSDQI